MKNPLRRSAVGALALGAIAGSAALGIHSAEAAWHPVTYGLHETPAQLLPATVSTAQPVRVVSTKLDAQGRPVVTVHTATSKAAAAKYVTQGQKATNAVGVELDAVTTASGALADCAERDIGVAVLKVGSSEGGARAAGAHTGALAGDQRVFAALLGGSGRGAGERARRAARAGAGARGPGATDRGAVRARPRRRAGRRGGLAILTCSGGDSGVAADLAAERGLELPELSPATRERLAAVLPSAATVGEPARLHLDALGRPRGARGGRRGGRPRTRRSTSCCCSSTSRGDSTRRSPRAGTRCSRALLAGAARGDAATILGSTLPELLDPDGRGGAGRRRASRPPPGSAPRSPAPPRSALRPPTRSGCGRSPRRRKATVDRRSGQPTAGRRAAVRGTAARRGGGEGGCGRGRGKRCSRQVARRAGGRSPSTSPARSTRRGQVGMPVALKLSSPSLLHKTEAGALALDLRDEDEVREAATRLCSRCRRRPTRRCWSSGWRATGSS